MPTITSSLEPSASRFTRHNAVLCTLFAQVSDGQYATTIDVSIDICTSVAWKEGKAVRELLPEVGTTPRSALVNF